MEKNIVTENTVEESTTQAIADTVFIVHREKARNNYGKPIMTKNGAPLYNYVLPIEIKGRKTRVDFATADKGGFEVLDFVFGDKDTAELCMADEVMEISGKKQTIKRYEIRSVDEDGVIFSCTVKPQRRSDTDLLNMYLNILSAKSANA